MSDEQLSDTTQANLSARCHHFFEQAQKGILTSPDDVSLCFPSQISDIRAICIGAVLTLLTVATAGGNLLICTAILIVRRLRHPANLLIFNLALSDFLVSVLVLPFAIIYQLFGYWPFNNLVCDVYVVCDVLLCTASILSLCAISVDRYLAITRPLNYAVKRTTRRMISMIAICWLIASLISVPPLFSWEKPNVLFHCGYSESLTYQIYATFSAFYIPLFVMIVLYGRVYFIVRRVATQDAQKTFARGSTRGRTNTVLSIINGSGSRNSAWGVGCKDELKMSTTPVHLSAGILRKNGPENEEEDQSEENRLKSTPVKELPAQFRCHNQSILYLDTTGIGAQNTQYWHGKSSSASVASSRWTGYFSKSRSRGTQSSLVPSERGLAKKGSYSNSENMKAVITLGVIMGTFTFCWLPFFSCQLITPIMKALKVSHWEQPPLLMFQFFLWLGYMNSLLNPIIYAKFNQDFRLPFCYILKCQCRGINQRVRRHSFAAQFQASYKIPLPTNGHIPRPRQRRSRMASHQSQLMEDSATKTAQNCNALTAALASDHSNNTPVAQVHMCDSKQKSVIESY